MRLLPDLNQTTFGLDNRALGYVLLDVFLLFLASGFLSNSSQLRAAFTPVLTSLGVLSACDEAWFEASAGASLKVVFISLAWLMGACHGLPRNIRLERDVRFAVTHRDAEAFVVPLLLLALAVFVTKIMFDLCFYGASNPVGDGKRAGIFPFFSGLIVYFSMLVAVSHVLSWLRGRRQRANS